MLFSDTHFVEIDSLIYGDVPYADDIYLNLDISEVENG